MLNTYLPDLISFTYKIIDDGRLLSGKYQQKLWDHESPQQIHFLFPPKEKWLTIWIDHAALKESYWQTFKTNSSRSDSTASKRKCRFDE